MDCWTLTELARAKVNLTLRVLGRRPDGFHELDSIVAFADLGDRVTLHVDAPARVDVTGPFAAAIVGENLAARALELAARTVPELRLGTVSIDKQLPIAAGLGGGSADAAAVLRLLVRANPGLAETIDWLALAAQLGSDVPVCFENRACRMTGRGEVLTPIGALPSLPAVLVNPQVPVPTDKTRQVFQRLAAPLLKASPLAVTSQPTASASLGDWIAFLRDATNNLEAPATAVTPAIESVIDTLRAHSSTPLARLSGAGPTCFALTATAAEAQALARNIAAQRPTWWVRAAQLV